MTLAEIKRRRIIRRLETLKFVEGIHVQVTGPEQKTVSVVHNKERTLSFKFTWHNDHFVGKFIDSGRRGSQAVISLWRQQEADEYNVPQKVDH
jgi:hypothetical protein